MRGEDSNHPFHSNTFVRWNLVTPGTYDDDRTLLTAIENGVNNNFAMTYALAP